MNQIMKVGIIALATAALGIAESWTGKLIDATCKQDPNAPKEAVAASCAPTSSTRVFAVQTADGRVFRLDNAGNMKAAAAMKNDPGQTSVTVSGSLDGQTVKVDSIDLND
jgi:hypothetical protein